MQSPINTLPSQSRPTRPASLTADAAESEGREIVPTPATAHAPKGYIFIDAYRGTIFWEADIVSDDSSSSHSSSTNLGLKSDEKPAETAKEKECNLGSCFEIQWMSTTRLPFYRTRGLRNPWNANRDVKVARDGTELETHVGIRILELFHQTNMSVAWDPNTGSGMGYPMQSPVEHSTQAFFKFQELVSSSKAHS